MREESPIASNWRASGTLRDYLIANNVVAIADIDTRELTRLLRSAGVMRGVIATGDVDTGELVQQARAIPQHGRHRSRARGHVRSRRSTGRPASTRPAAQVRADLALAPQTQSKRPLRVAAYDFGIKWNILRRLATYGCQVHVVPASTPAKEVLARGRRRHLPEQRPRRSGGRRLRHREHARADAGRQADLRHLPRPPDSRPRARRKDVQAEVRPSRRQSSGEVSRDRQGRDHVAESRLCGRSRVAAGRCEGDAPESLRRNGRRAEGDGPADLLGAVSSRGVAGPARRRLPVQAVRRGHGKRRG